MVRDCVFVVIISVCFLLLGTLNMQAETLSDDHEYRIKADYLANFAKFVEWPADAFTNPNDPLIIAVLGKDPFEKFLDEAAKDSTVQGRNLIVKRFRTIDDLERCHILFVADSKINSLSDILYIIGDWPVLTVSNRKDLTNRGGIIKFFDDDDRISFEINANAAEQARIKISSKLMKLAHGKNITHKG